VAYSVEFRYPQEYVLRRGGSLFCLLRMRCGHQHLTIKSAAKCKDRLAHRPIGMGYFIGQFGRIAEITTRRFLTDEEIGMAIATELDETEAFRIVLNLAKRNILKGHALTGERARQIAACKLVEKFVVRLR